MRENVKSSKSQCLQRVRERIALQLHEEVKKEIDDMLIVTEGSEDQHMQTVEEVLRTQDETGIRLKIEKCGLAVI